MMIFDTVDSTQLEARRLINKKKFINNLSLLALSQTSGITRKDGIPWHSPKGNIYLTQIAPLNEKSKFITFCMSLAALDYISSISKNISCKLKWPNDILINNKKIGGVICEIYKNHTILGIALNLKTHPNKTHNFPATNILQELDHITYKSHNLLELQTCANEILTNFKKYIDILTLRGFKEIKNLWLKNAFHINKNISLIESGIEAQCIGLDDNGSMICKTKTNKIIAVNSDEIKYII